MDNTDSLVAINIIVGEDRIVNKDGVPLLFYWNGLTDVLEDIKHSDALKSFLESSNIFNDETRYTSAKAVYFYYNDGEYKQESHDVQAIYPISALPLKKALLRSVVKTLYSLSFEKPIGNKPMKDACAEIMEKYSSKLSEETFKNAIRGKLQESYKGLSSANVDAVMEYADEVIFN